MREATIYYFDEYGERNTEHVIQAVIERLEERDINTVIVASSSGKIAIKLAERLREANREAKVICISDPPQAEEWPKITPKDQAKLEALGAEIIDYVPYASMAYSWKAPENVYGALAC